MDTTVTIAFKPVTLGPTSDQRFRSIQMYLSLAGLFEELGEHSRAEPWRKAARDLGWKEEWKL